MKGMEGTGEPCMDMSPGTSPGRRRGERAGYNEVELQQKAVYFLVTD